MSIVGESILSASIELLIKKLASEGIRLFARQEQIEADLIKWKKILLKIKAVLEDADDKQTIDQWVKMWLLDLQNLASDVEDILDEFETETHWRKQFLESQHHPSTSKLRKLLPTCCYNFNPHNIKFDYRMMSKIKDINDRLQDISAQQEQLELKEISGGLYKKVRERRKGTSLVTEANVCGRKEDKEKIVNLLLSPALSRVDGFLVIPITGMGGLGKTTLAQLVYNDNTVESYFHFKAWACVSDDYDAVRITKTLLRFVDDSVGDVNDLNLLQERLKRILRGRKFLLVLDDIWNENPNDWELLSRPFGFGAPGSRIIITTRNEGVSSMVTTDKIYYLGTLSDGDCLRIFAEQSLGRADFTKHQHLKEIGEKIVKTCNGLPLAAESLGRVLRGKYNLGDWEKVLTCKIWDLPEEKCDIMRALKVSYFYLPAHLKQCFAYCSLLPKDYEFCEREIVLLWMAEGLLQLDASKEIEEIGHDYFQELQSRSFFQQTTRDTFFIHGLINDLAQWVSREIYVRMEEALETNKQQNFSKNLRHLSYIRGEYDGIRRFETISDAKHLRSFLPVVLSNFRRRSWLAYSVVHLLLKLRRLRVLSLRGYGISRLPDSIGDLKYLRHLDLSETDIKALPESTNTLYSLLTLRVENCFRLKKLCGDMGNLIKLRNLDNTNVPLLEEMPLGINKLTCLQTLCSFVVGKDTGSGLRELKSLMHLRETLEISKLENVKDVGDAREAEMNGKKNLKVLLLNWSSSNGNSRETEFEKHVLDVLKPHEKLEELTIRGYGGISFPIWLGDSSFSNLVLLIFEGCGMCTSLPSVGRLLFLKHLFISEMAGIKTVGSEFYGYNCLVPFPSLESLCFRNMQEWEEWIPHGCQQEDEAGFPRLQELQIVGCSKLLGRLPERLLSLQMLVIQNCEQLLVSLPSLSTLRELEVDRCKEVAWRSEIDLSSLESVSLSGMSNQVFLTGLFTQKLPKLQELSIYNCVGLTNLWQNESGLLRRISFLHRLDISYCPQLLSLIGEEEKDQHQQVVPCSTIRYLELRQCFSLSKLPQTLLSLWSLSEMRIIGCYHLVSFPEASLPYQLRVIVIERCYSLRSLPDSWRDPGTCLERLSIDACNSLTNIARVHLPLSLKKLDIGNCNSLINLIYEDQILIMGEEYYWRFFLLEYLCIRGCPSLTSMWAKNELPDTLEHLDVSNCSMLAFLSPGGKLPRSLKYLSVDKCSKLESIAERLDNNSRLETIHIMNCKNLKVLPDGLYKLHHLKEVIIINCSNLVSFPEKGLSSLKLTDVYIDRCEKLVALPNPMYSLDSLQHLTLKTCPSIVSFPEHGFPNNLSTLAIVDMKICTSLLDWGLHRFSVLRDLRISGGCPELVSFPPENTGMMLPATLTKLKIDNFLNLERISSISENLSSLQYLYLSDCPKLKSFPENGLPVSLLYLSITDCPLLQERCKKPGEYWFMIANNIPYIRIGPLVLTEED